jgi:hypothetical protein
MSRTRRSVATAVAIGALAGGLGGAGTANAADTLTAKLSGKNEPDGGKGSGSASLTLRPNKGQICYRITLKGTGTVSAGHIHKGGKGVAGDVYVGLFDKPANAKRGCVDATKKQIRALLRKPGGYYVNVHSAEYPAGVARGQLRT